MSLRRPVSFWSHTLNLEVLTASLALLLMLTGGLVTARAMEQRDIELFRADAEKMNLYLHDHLANGVIQLDRLPPRPTDPVPGKW